MKRILLLLLATLTLACKSAVEPSSSESFVLTQLSVLDKITNDSAAFPADGTYNSYIQFDWASDNSIHGSGRLGFLHWPNYEPIDSLPRPFWLYRGNCLDSACLDANAGEINGWADYDSTSSNFLFVLKQYKGKDTFLETIPYRVGLDSAGRKIIFFIEDTHDYSATIVFTDTTK